MNTAKERKQLLLRVEEFFGRKDINYVGEPGEDPIDAFVNNMKLIDKWCTALYDGLKAHSIIICGGAITSVFTGAPIKDLDFYVSDPDKLAGAIAFIETYFPKDTVFKSINALTWTRFGGQTNRKKYQVQLITKFTGSPQKIFDDFDFTVVQGCYDFSSDSFVFGDRFLTDIASRRIVFCGKSHYPICAMYRTLKYQRKGFKLSGTTVIHIALAIARLEIKTYKELKEQLFGIDTMFMARFLENRDDETPVDYAEFIKEVFDQEVEQDDDEYED